MRRFIALAVFIIGASTLAPAQEVVSTWKGYLVDQMCAENMDKERADYYAKRHTRACNFHDDCKASGFGLMIRGTFIELADSSVPKVIAYLESIDKRNAIYVAVTGVMRGVEVDVEQIETAEEPEEPEE